MRISRHRARADEARPGTALEQAPAPDDDVWCLGDFYQQHAPRLAERLHRRLRSRDDANDMVQDAFTRLVRSPQVAKLRQPEAFLNRIVRNLLINHSNSPRRKAEHVPIDEDLGLSVPADQTHAIELEEMRQQYRAAVAALPPRMREVFVLHRIEELTYRQIAERLDISVRTVEWYFAEAIVRIDEALTRE